MWCCFVAHSQTGVDYPGTWNEFLTWFSDESDRRLERLYHLSQHDFTRSGIVLSDTQDPAHVSMPAAHQVVSLLKRWLPGAHQGSAKPPHLQSLSRRIYISLQPPQFPSTRLTAFSVHGTSHGNSTLSIVGGKR